MKGTTRPKTTKKRTDKALERAAAITGNTITEWTKKTKTAKNENIDDSLIESEDSGQSVNSVMSSVNVNSVVSMRRVPLLALEWEGPLQAIVWENELCGEKDSGKRSQAQNHRVYARKKVWTKLKNGLFAWRIARPRQLPGMSTVGSTAEREPLLTSLKQNKYLETGSDAIKNKIYSNKRKSISGGNQMAGEERESRQDLDKNDGDEMIGTKKLKSI